MGAQQGDDGNMLLETEKQMKKQSLSRSKKIKSSPGSRQSGERPKVHSASSKAWHLPARETSSMGGQAGSPVEWELGEGCAPTNASPGSLHEAPVDKPVLPLTSTELLEFWSSTAKCQQTGLPDTWGKDLTGTIETKTDGRCQGGC